MHSTQYIEWEGYFSSMLLITMLRLKMEGYSLLEEIKASYEQNYIRGLADSIESVDDTVDGSHIVKRVILPSSFTAGARYQHQLYQDAMAIVCHFGKPDLFITFTCNPHWEEITNALLEHQTAADHQDLISRVFKLKLKSLLHDIYYGSVNVLGNMIALIYVIEWQKRQPPHVHILGICEEESKPRALEDYDSIVCAEIPNKE